MHLCFPSQMRRGSVGDFIRRQGVVPECFTMPYPEYHVCQ
jgi:hypothetical protein